MPTPPPQAGPSPVRWTDAPTRTVEAAGATFAYRELGSHHDGVPLVGLPRLGGNLDSWDPALVEAIAKERRVVLLSYRGVGASTGAPHDDLEAPAADAVAAIRALGLDRVDVLGHSMGGMVAQEVLRLAPEVVARVILIGAGPSSGTGLTTMTRTMIRAGLRGIAILASPTTVMFFTRTPAGRHAAREYHQRLRTRRRHRDARVSPAAMRAQLRAVRRWGLEAPQNTPFDAPALIIHGDSDLLVPHDNAPALAARFRHADLHVFGDSGHGVASQHHARAAELSTHFLRR